MKSFACGPCGLVYHHSPAPAAAGILYHADRIILTKRARPPQQGLYTLPGGFLEYGESFEGALARELHEELNLPVTAPRYLCSHWGEYLYASILYYTTIAYFIVHVEEIGPLRANDDVENFTLVHPMEIDLSALAFDGDRVALTLYCRLMNSPGSPAAGPGSVPHIP